MNDQLVNIILNYELLFSAIIIVIIPTLSLVICNSLYIAISLIYLCIGIDTQIKNWCYWNIKLENLEDIVEYKLMWYTFDFSKGRLRKDIPYHIKEKRIFEILDYFNRKYEHINHLHYMVPLAFNYKDFINPKVLTIFQIINISSLSQKHKNRLEIKIRNKYNN
jgi:hypothetical protein